MLKLTTEEFIEKSNTRLDKFIKKCQEKHGDIYDYSKVNYINTKTKIIIICKIHGDFLQTPHSHINNGSGCPKCSYKYKLTTEKFIEKSKLIHIDKYDYSKVDYKYSNENIIIICKKHGNFLQTPHSHLNSNGCSKCSDCYKLTTKEFIEKSKLIHIDKYDYSKVNYKYSNENVIIVCKIHGEFLQTPSNHYYNGTGCPNCYHNYSKPSIIWLNFLSKFYNINIIHAENANEFIIPKTKFRADGYCKENNTIYEFHGDFWHGNPNIYNQDEINKKKIVLLKNYIIKL